MRLDNRHINAILQSLIPKADTRKPKAQNFNFILCNNLTQNKIK